MFSGGTDSAYALWYYLTQTRSRVHVHHIDHKLVQSNEWRAEKQAVNVMRPLFKRYRQFSYSNSGIDMDGLSWSRPTDYVLFTAFQVAKKRMTQTTGSVSLGLGWTESEDRIQYPEGTTESIYSALHESWRQYIRTAPVKYQGRFNESLMQPFYKISKNDMFHTLPSEIRANLWSCKKPMKKGNIYIPCGKCLKCLDFKERVNVN